MKEKECVINRLAKECPGGFSYYSVGYKTERGYEFVAHFESAQEAINEAKKQCLTAYKNWSWKTETVAVDKTNI